MRPAKITQDDLSSDDSVYDYDKTSFVQGETDRILSYYENHAATGSLDSDYERGPGNLRKSPGTEKSSGSEYSLDNTSSSSINKPHGREQRQEGSSGRSERRMRRQSRFPDGGSNRRRISVVVERNSGAPVLGRHNSTHAKVSDTPDGLISSRARRELKEGGSSVPVVEAAHASSRSAHTALLPHSSVPAHITKIPDESSGSRHQRPTSASRGVRDLRPPEAGIVGADQGHADLHSNNSYSHAKTPESASIFRKPSKSHLSPLPKPEMTSPSSAYTSGMQSTPISSAVGKTDIRQPLVGVASLHASTKPSSISNMTTTYTTSQTTFSPSVPLSYLHYQPGIHSTAGPPPPPIQRLFVAASSNPPPRPPRLYTPTTSNSSRKSEQVNTKDNPPSPNHVPSRPSSKSSYVDSPSVQLPEQQVEASSGKEIDGINDVTKPPVTLRPSRSMHIREGAFPPSTSGTISPQTSPQSSAINDSVTSVTSQEVNSPPTTDDEQCSSKEVEIVDASSSGHSHDKHGSPIRPVLGLRRESSWVNLTVSDEIKSAAKETEVTPTNTTGRSSPMRATLTNLKRFSALPRTPSLMSMSLLVSGETKVSRSPSPSLPPIPARPRVKSHWPAAMQFNDVLANHNSLDRSIGYANKINELALYDCGLGEWIIAVKHRGTTRRPTSRPESANSAYRAPSSFTDYQKPRQTSQGSLASEFPTRPDAHIATDLSPRPDDNIPTASPSLPYPALAQSSRSNTRFSMLASPTSTRTLPIGINKTGAFFASLGKKATPKKDKDRTSQPMPPKFLTKRFPSTSAPRPVELGSAPVVPGGPRAAPNRSQSIVAPPATDEAAKAPQQRRRLSLARRPSLFSSPKGAPPTATTVVRNSAEFTEQLEKLVILLPHADKNVLSGYLRRSGQDILAVGRYLEDEKNGTIIHS